MRSQPLHPGRPISPATPAPSCARRASQVAAGAVLIAWCGTALAVCFFPNAGGIATGVASAAGGATERLGTLADLLRVGYAFSVGMVAAVNPCGFALLPAYLARFAGDDSGTPAPLAQHLARACLVGALVTAGFVALFGLAGLAITLAKSAIAGVLAWVGVAVGTALVAVGGWQLGGGTLPGGPWGALAARLGSAARVRPGAGDSGAWGYVAYGLAYGLASLGCALPLFLGVVGTALVTEGALPALRQYLLYALGMGTVVTALTVLAALARRGVARAIGRATRYLGPLGALLLVLAGTYVIYYWLTDGALLGGLGRPR